jgi:hypothetical protein
VNSSSLPQDPPTKVKQVQDGDSVNSSSLSQNPPTEVKRVQHEGCVNSSSLPQNPPAERIRNEVSAVPQIGRAKGIRCGRNKTSGYKRDEFSG